MLTVGRILAVQEHRFRLLTPTGQVYLFTLGRTARLDELQLARARDDRSNLEVEFTGQPNLLGGVARSVRRTDDA